MPKSKSKSPVPTQRAEFIDFDVDEVVNPGIVERVSQTVCPFGEGLACNSPGCMVCDEGPRCCSPGDTCYLKDQDVTNWCTGFRGVDFSGTTWEFDGLARQMRRGSSNAAQFYDPPSFWERG
jgi:hypothetical protein